MKIIGRKIDSSFFQNVPLEEVACSLCGSRDAKMLERRDCIGLPVKTAMCRKCGLIYINPRPTEEWYKDYYDSLGGRQYHYKYGGENRPMSPLGSGFEGAKKHGRGLALRLGKYMKPGLTIDVGSSEGGVLAGIREIVNIQPLGIEPVKEEADYATSRGIPTYAALIENIKSLGIKLTPASNIVCAKALNHLLDPAKFFSWAWLALAPDGRLILEVKNFRQQCRRSGRITSGIQLDHPYMFVPETLAALVERAGFEVMFMDADESKSRQEIKSQLADGLPVSHIRIVGKKIEREPFSSAFRPRPRVSRILSLQFNPIALYCFYLFRRANLRKNIKARIFARRKTNKLIQ